MIETLNTILSFLHGHMAAVIASAVVAVIDFLIEKTTLVKAGSTLSLIFNGIKSAIQKLGIGKPQAPLT